MPQTLAVIVSVQGIRDFPATLVLPDRADDKPRLDGRSVPLPDGGPYAATTNSPYCPSLQVWVKQGRLSPTP